MGRRALTFGVLGHAIVSIHSPAKKVGRRLDCQALRNCSSSFNPLPSQEGGETLSASLARNQRGGFNPLPSQEGGETQEEGRVFKGYYQVSIHSPAKKVGRRSLLKMLKGNHPKFQSTPQPRRWGDSTRNRFPPFSLICFNPLPSQEGGETNPPATSGRLMIVSIHSPAKKVGRLDTPLLANHGHVRFNPLPSQEGGETPLPINLKRSLKCFNPLPSQEGGETLMWISSPSTNGGFNPLPSQEGGETSALLGRRCGA